MLSKELLTRWNRDAIVHAKERDLKALIRRPRLRHRDPMDPRSFFELQVTTSGGGAVPQAKLTPHGIIGSGKINPSFGGRRQIPIIGNMGRKYIDYGPQAVLGATRPGNTNWGATILVGGTTIAIADFAAADKMYEFASGLNRDWLVNIPAAYAAQKGNRRLQPYLSHWLFFTTDANITNTRWWLVLTRTDPTLLDAPGADTVGILFSDGLNGNRFSIEAADAAGVVTSQDSGITVAREVEYFCEIYHDDVNARWVCAINETEFFVTDAQGPGGGSVAMAFIGVISRNKSGADTAGVCCGGQYYEQS